MMRRLAFTCAVICLLAVASGCDGNEASVSGAIPQQTAGGDQAGAKAKGGEGPDVFSSELSESDVASWHLNDFSDGFLRQWKTTEEDYQISEGTDCENTIVSLRGEDEGACIYIVAGLHGDETAGWIAGNLLKELTIRRGMVYILSPANRYGALNNQRETKSGFDPNRYFPGKADGMDAEAIDAAIFADIKEKAPDLVLDFHEAEASLDGSDELGNSIICEDVSLPGDLIWDILLASEDGAFCGETLSLFGTPPKGSMNRTVTRDLGIPVITIETKREEQLVRRVSLHLRITEFILNRYGIR